MEGGTDDKQGRGAVKKAKGRRWTREPRQSQSLEGVGGMLRAAPGLRSAEVG